MAAEDGPLICFAAGTAEDFFGQVVDEPQVASGTWTWDGTTTVLATDTSGVAVDDWIQLDASQPLFKVLSIVANTSVLIQNTLGLTIPIGTGVLAASPVNLSEAVDGTPDRPAVIIFEWRKGNSRIFKKVNYDSEEIQVLDQGTNPGQFLLRTDEPDTDQALVAITIGEPVYLYELAISRQDIARSGAQAGTVDVTAGSNDLVGVGTVFSEARPGDIIHLTSGGASGQFSRIIEVTDDTNLVVDRTNWITTAGASFEIRRGKILPGQRGPGQIDHSSVRLEV